MNYNLYFRENAPSCFMASLFENENELDYLIQTLLSSGLDWYWSSERTYEVMEAFKNWNLPKLRYLTLLTEENKQDLYRDFLEEDSYVPHRSIELFAVEPNRKISSASELRSKIQDFLVRENPELKCVIIQISDMFEQYIFVHNNPDNRISRLLSYWRLSKDSAGNVYKYTRLNSIQLEYLADAISKNAFPQK